MVTERRVLWFQASVKLQFMKQWAIEIESGFKKRENNGRTLKVRNVKAFFCSHGING